MPIGGKLVLKGGVTLAGGVDKKKKKKAKSVTAGEGAEPTNDAGNEADGAAPGQPGASGAVGTGSKPPSAVPATAVNVMSGKAYEQEFEFETKRMEEGKVRCCPGSTTFVQLLHVPTLGQHRSVSLHCSRSNKAPLAVE